MQTLYVPSGAESPYLTAPYIMSVCSDLENNQHAFYSFLLNAPKESFCIHLVYDFRTQTDLTEFDNDFQCSFSVREFIRRAADFHKNDSFIICLDGDEMMLHRASDFNTEVVHCLFSEYFRNKCRLSLHGNRRFKLSENTVLSSSDRADIEALIEKINDEIISDLQMQYDVLKRLDFIQK